MARVRTPVGVRSRTKQSFKEESDLNSVMRRYRNTGLLPNLNQALGHYGDFSNADDYLAAMESVREADALFAALPARVRDHVNNDPAQLLLLVHDPERRAELQELGLVPPPPVEPVVPAGAPAVPPAAPAPGAPVVPIQGGS